MQDTIIKDSTVIISKIIYKSASESIELINKVDSFYNSAWTMLIVTVSIFGFVVPLLFNWYQNRQTNLDKSALKENIITETGNAKTELKAEINTSITSLKDEIEAAKKTLKDEIEKSRSDLKTEIEKARIELKEEIRKEYGDEILKLNKVVNKKVAKLEGMSYHIEANMFWQSQSYNTATKSYFTALSLYIASKEYNHFSVIHHLIINRSFKKITKKDLTEIFKKKGYTSEEYYSYLIDKAQNNQKFIDGINEIKAKAKELPDKKE